MKTFFASAERVGKKKIASEIESINSSPILNGLLSKSNGMLAVLNKHRQVLALNDTLLKDLGIDNSEENLGLRPGEIVNCIYSQDNPGGCGTSKYCSTCGAAIAIVSAVHDEIDSEKICTLTIDRSGILVDLVLSVQAQSIEIENQKFILLYLKDITVQQQRAALERTFFHDIKNMLVGLLGSAELLLVENIDSELPKNIHESSLRLIKEIEIQRCLSQNEFSGYETLKQMVSDTKIEDEIKIFFRNHPVANNKKIEFISTDSSFSIVTDLSLLTRVLCNMILNALEATETNGRVKVWFDKDDHLLQYSVWNDKSMSKKISLRIFQRNFSTKEGEGRGIGTYSMKLLGEKILGGKVTFTSAEENGTVFTFSLPL